jgi:hypothetical protein
MKFYSTERVEDPIGFVYIKKSSRRGDRDYFRFKVCLYYPSQLGWIIFIDSVT